MSTQSKRKPAAKKKLPAKKKPTAPSSRKTSANKPTTKPLSEAEKNLQELMGGQPKEVEGAIEEEQSDKLQSKGLGDTISKITEATGIKKIVKAFKDGEDCGCDKRMDFLNRIFPYNKVECLTEPEYNQLLAYFEANEPVITVEHRNILLPIYNRVFNLKQENTSCRECWMEIEKDLKKLFDSYENNK